MYFPAAGHLAAGANDRLTFFESIGKANRYPVIEKESDR
jgi:hypothetical protein